jgi:hypothetical protein
MDVDTLTSDACPVWGQGCNAIISDIFRLIRWIRIVFALLLVTHTRLTRVCMISHKSYGTIYPKRRMTDFNYDEFFSEMAQVAFLQYELLRAQTLAPEQASARPRKAGCCATISRSLCPWHRKLFSFVPCHLHQQLRAKDLA